MKKATMLLTTKLMLAMLLFTFFTNAQTSVNSAGGDASSSDGSIAYSIGQVDFSNYSSASGEINLGVQQPFEILLLSVHEAALNWEVTVFPNPTANQVYVQYEEFQSDALTYELLDVSGKLLLSGELKNGMHTIDMQHLSSSTYLLKLSDNQSILKTFRLVKQ